MPDGTDIEIKRGRKFDQVLSGARDVFLRDGFEGASVDDIARAAGVSKATLYSYFPDKRLLFMGESSRFPELGREFYASGPQMGRNRLVDLLACGVERGELKIDDLELAADQLAQLCKVDLFDRMVFSMAETFSDEEKTRIVNSAVDMFMARYGA